MPPFLSPDILNSFQAKILSNIPIEGNIGKVRQRNVVVGNYRGAPPEDCTYLLQHLCDWLNKDEVFSYLQNTYGKKTAGIIRAILVHFIHCVDSSL